ncbi:glycosyltransferase [Micromonospora sp. HM5-17]|jgi:glycosyltransferase involved in cell wall biosynthesis|uniref:glycosyltransferase n=1 Tax=Micromonospora sp. HM5-17 TaxID=2487710 RepID=UPI000F460AA4|nr:glycosyltransferase [Micromonospora sp. HM5-17]ROT33175.1 glycosyltransferase [Micromonospora sp. HM5-17]
MFVTQPTRRDAWVAIVGPFRFPWGQAGSRRVYGLAGSLAACGYDVVVAGGEDGPATATRLDGIDGPGTVDYLGLGEIPPAQAGRLARSVRWFLRWGERTVRWLDAQPTKPSHVLVSGGDAPYMVHLRRWCRRSRVPLLADVVDWYSPRQLRGGVLGPPYLSAQAALRYHYPRCDGIIVVSSFLEEYYRGRGTPVLRVPPTLDVENLPVYPRRVDADVPGLRLVYAGSPGRKDLVATIVRAVGRVDPEGAHLELRIFGPTLEQVTRLLDGEALPRGVRVLGRLPQPEIPRVWQEADFSVLLRQPARFIHAGFPTKFCESLANGTPVIANLTSDLGRYLRDRHEGLVCADHSVAGLTSALRTALGLTVAERKLMREAARRRARAAFDFRVYAEPVGAFFDALRR